MSDEEANLELMNSAKNYNRWIFETLRPYLGSRILEIGCGVGAMTRFFVNRKLVVGLDINRTNLKKIKARFRKRKNFFVHDQDLSKGKGALGKYYFDTVVAINVLEHVKDDLAMLKNSNAILAPRGRAVLFLPAFKSLYGTIDKADNHYRRYDKKDILGKLKRSGFVVEKMFYMNLPGFFGWYYHNRIIKTPLHPSGDISLFDRLVPVFSFFERILHPPFGLSLVVVARKRGRRVAV